MTPHTCVCVCVCECVCLYVCVCDIRHQLFCTQSPCHWRNQEKEKTPTTELNIFFPKFFRTENNKQQFFRDTPKLPKSSIMNLILSILKRLQFCQIFQKISKSVGFNSSSKVSIDNFSLSRKFFWKSFVVCSINLFYTCLTEIIAVRPGPLSFFVSFFVCRWFTEYWRKFC